MSSSAPPLPPAENQTQELLKFLREENSANRAAIRDDAVANRQLLLDTVRLVSIPVAVLIAVAAWFGFKSISDLKGALEAEARQSTQVEVSRMQNEIRGRISEQFQTPALQKMVKEAAAEQTKTASEPLIKQEVATQVKARVDTERPTIVAAVTEQTKAAVKQMGPQIDQQVRDSVEAKVQHQVEPVIQKLNTLKSDADLQRLIIRMDNDDAVAFDQLLAILSETTNVETTDLVRTAITDVVERHETAVTMGRDFKAPLTETQMLVIMMDTSHPPVDRETAIDKLLGTSTQNRSLVPKLVEVITSDPSLNVRCHAGRAFNNLTSQHFKCLDKPDQLAWWQANKKAFERTP